MKIMFSRIAARSGSNVTLAALPEEEPGYVEPMLNWIFITNYDENRQGDKWIYQEFDQNVARLFIFADPETGRSCYAFMSFDGEFTRLLPEGNITEQIPDAGLKGQPDSHGRIYGAAQIGDHVYACGDGGQFMRRGSDGRWSSVNSDYRLSTGEGMDMEELWKKENPPPGGDEYDGYWLRRSDDYINSMTRMFTNLGGLREDAIYLTSQVPNRQQGRIHFWNGETLSEIHNPSGEDINGFFFEDENRVWAYGRNGTILYGNHRDGFRDVSHYEDNMGLNGMGLFRGTMYLTSYAAESGLYMLDDNGRQVEVPDVPYKNGCTGISIAGGALWTADDYAVLRFDGVQWERIEHPQNIVSNTAP